MEETEIGGQHPRASLAPMPEPGQAHPPVSGLAMDGWEDCSSPSCSPKKSCCISLSASRCLSIPAYSSPRGRESAASCRDQSAAPEAPACRRYPRRASRALQCRILARRLPTRRVFYVIILAGKLRCGRASADFNKPSSRRPVAPPCRASSRSCKASASRSSIQIGSFTWPEREACCGSDR
jgi:hypothetical protein